MTWIDDATSYFNNFEYKFKVKTEFPYRYFLELRSFEYGCLMELDTKNTDEQPVPDILLLIRCGGTYCASQ